MEPLGHGYISKPIIGSQVFGQQPATAFPVGVPSQDKTLSSYISYSMTEAVTVTVGADELLLLDVHITDEDDDALHQAYIANEALFDQAIVAAIRSEIGTEPALIVSTQPGSIHTSFGTTPPKRRGFDLGRIKDAIVKAVRRVASTLGVNRLRPVARMAYKVLQFAVGVVAIVNGATELWTGQPSEALSVLHDWLRRLFGERGWSPA